MKMLDGLARILLIIGGLAWGLVGAADFNIVAALFGADSAVTRLVYVLVGLAALYEAIGFKAIRRRWCEVLSQEEARTGG